MQPENRFFTNAEYNTVGEKVKGWRLDPSFLGQRLLSNPRDGLDNG